MRNLAPVIATMTLVVVASNILVQHPVTAFGLADKLTWGAFAYPVAFLVTDLTNRRFGPSGARRVVYCGFAIAVGLSIWLATPRIAVASATAFLIGQLLDVSVFAQLRRQKWWRAPLFASLAGSAVDTVLFFTLAFAGVASMSAPTALLGSAFTAPLWANLAAFDFLVKALAAGALLAPYGVLMNAIRPLEAAPAAR